MIRLYDKKQQLLRIVNEDSILRLDQTQKLTDERYVSDILEAEINAIDEEIIKQTEYVSIPDDDKTKHHLFWLKNYELDETLNLTGVQSGIEELSKQLVLDTRPNNQNARIMANRVLENTTWEVGYMPTTGAMSTSFYNTDAFSAIKKIASLFSLEFEFFVEISNTGVGAKYINFGKQVGTYKGARVTYGHNALEIVRESDKSDIYTALVGLGRGAENNRVLDRYMPLQGRFKRAEYVSLDQGNKGPGYQKTYTFPNGDTRYHYVNVNADGGRYTHIVDTVGGVATEYEHRTWDDMRVKLPNGTVIDNAELTVQTETGQVGYERKTTFEEVEWTTEAGNPVYKPLGQKFIEIPEATHNYGVYNHKTGNMLPKFGYVEFDTDDPEELAELTYEALLQSIRPKIEMRTSTVYLDAEIGDRVRVTRPEYDWDFETRVFEIRWDRLTGYADIKLGDKLILSPYERDQQLAGKLVDTVESRTNFISQELLPNLQESTIRTLSANQFNSNFFGAIDPVDLGQKPKVGDIWFRPHPDDEMHEIIYMWDGEQWEVIMDTLNYDNEIKAHIEAVEADLDAQIQLIEENDRKANSILEGIGIAGLGESNQEIAQRVKGVLAERQDQFYKYADEKDGILTETIAQIKNNPEGQILGYNNLVQSVGQNTRTIGQLNENMEGEVSRAIQASGLIQSEVEKAIQPKKTSLYLTKGGGMYDMTCIEPGGDGIIGEVLTDLKDGHKYRIVVYASERNLAEKDINLDSMDYVHTYTPFKNNLGHGEYEFEIIYHNHWPTLKTDKQIKLWNRSNKRLCFYIVSVEEYEQSGEEKFTRSQIRQMSNEIALRAKKDDLLSEINVQAGGIVFRSGDNKLRISPETTYIQNATIQSAHINSLHGSKITANSIHGNRIIANSLDVNRISGFTSEFVQSYWNAINRNITIDGRGIVASARDGWQTWFGNYGLVITTRYGTEIGGLKALVETSTKAPWSLDLVAEQNYDVGLGYQGETVDNVYHSAISVGGKFGDIKIHTPFRPGAGSRSGSGRRDGLQLWHQTISGNKGTAILYNENYQYEYRTDYGVVITEGDVYMKLNGKYFSMVELFRNNGWTV